MDEDAVIIVETEVVPEIEVAKKRKTDISEGDLTIKKRKLDDQNGHSEKDVCIVDSGDSDDEPQHVVTIQKVTPRKHKVSTDDECSIVYDDTANKLKSPKKIKSSN